MANVSLLRVADNEMRDGVTLHRNKKKIFYKYIVFKEVINNLTDSRRY